MPEPCVIIMGVSGVGKTTIGRLLAKQLDGNFIDADDFHPATNLKKMAGGTPLTDDDRLPWLKRLSRKIKERKDDKVLVIACSALKDSYRQILTSDGCRYVYLKGSEAEIANRIRQRIDHFMPPQLLHSQFAVLDEPTNAITIPILWAIDDIVEHIVRSLDY